MTGGPSAGPSSAYPTFRTPALICFSARNIVCAPGFTAGSFRDGALPVCAWADAIAPTCAAATAMAAVARKWRRLSSICSGLLLAFIGQAPGSERAERGCDGPGVQTRLISTLMLPRVALE